MTVPMINHLQMRVRLFDGMKTSHNQMCEDAELAIVWLADDFLAVLSEKLIIFE